MKNVNNNNVRSLFNVKRRVPVFTKNRKKEFRILMTREIFETARNLKVYAGAEHPHQAQNPKLVNLNDIR